MTNDDRGAAAEDSTTAAAEQGALRRNRLVFGLVAAPLGVLVALVLEFAVQIDYAWRGTNHGGGAAGPQVIAVVIGLLATVPALIAGIGALRGRVAPRLAPATTVVAAIGLVAVVFLVIVPAFDVLPRAARDEASYREQQQRDELEDVGWGGPSSAAAAGDLAQPIISDALADLDLGVRDVRQRTWFSEGTTAVGNRCRQFHERIELPDDLDRETASKTLTSSWSSEGRSRSFSADAKGNLELFDQNADATITFIPGEGRLVVATGCIPYAGP